jgi:hypothetical protein
MNFFKDYFKSEPPVQESNLSYLTRNMRYIEKANMLCEKYGADSGRKLVYEFNPLVTENTPECFALNSPSTPIIIDKPNYYVNRVLIPIDIRVDELEKLMVQMKAHYSNNKFKQKNTVTHVGFGYPTNKGTEYLRETECGRFYEIRLCAKGYPNEC